MGLMKILVGPANQQLGKIMKIELSIFQRNNLLQFLNRVELKGYDEANALLELVQIIKDAKEEITKE